MNLQKEECILIFIPDNLYGYEFIKKLFFSKENINIRIATRNIVETKSALFDIFEKIDGIYEYDPNDQNLFEIQIKNMLSLKKSSKPSKIIYASDLYAFNNKKLSLSNDIFSHMHQNVFDSLKIIKYFSDNSNNLKLPKIIYLNVYDEEKIRFRKVNISPYYVNINLFTKLTIENLLQKSNLDYLIINLPESKYFFIYKPFTKYVTFTNKIEFMKQCLSRNNLVKFLHKEIINNNITNKENPLSLNQSSIYVQDYSSIYEFFKINTFYKIANIASVSNMDKRVIRNNGSEYYNLHCKFSFGLVLMGISIKLSAFVIRKICKRNTI